MTCDLSYLSASHSEHFFFLCVFFLYRISLHEISLITAVLKSCAEYKASNLLNQEGDSLRVIDPDGDGILAPFTVQCNAAGKLTPPLLPYLQENKFTSLSARDTNYFKRYMYFLIKH